MRTITFEKYKKVNSNYGYLGEYLANLIQNQIGKKFTCKLKTSCRDKIVITKDGKSFTDKEKFTILSKIKEIIDLDKMEYLRDYYHGDWEIRVDIDMYLILKQDITIEVES